MLTHLKELREDEPENDYIQATPAWTYIDSQVVGPFFTIKDLWIMYDEEVITKEEFRENAKMLGLKLS